MTILAVAVGALVRGVLSVLQRLPQFLLPRMLARTDALNDKLVATRPNWVLRRGRWPVSWRSLGDPILRMRLALWTDERPIPGEGTGSVAKPSRPRSLWPLAPPPADRVDTPEGER